MRNYFWASLIIRREPSCEGFFVRRNKSRSFGHEEYLELPLWKNISVLCGETHWGSPYRAIRNMLLHSAYFQQRTDSSLRFDKKTGETGTI